jgi:hypothetical protein
LHAAEVTPSGEAVEPEPVHWAGPAAPDGVRELAEMVTLAPDVSVTPVSTHASCVTSTVNDAVMIGRQPDEVPQHFCDDVQHV